MTRSFLALAICVALILGFFDKGQITGDGQIRWNTLVQLMEHHQLTEQKYSIVMPLFAAPLYAAADAGTRLVHPGIADEARLDSIHRVVQRFNKLVAFVLVLGFYGASRRFFGLSARQATWGVALLLFGSFLAPHAKDFYSEILWTSLTLTWLLLVATLREPGVAMGPRVAVLVTTAALATALNPLLGPVLAGTSLVAAAMPPSAGRRMLARAGAPEILWTMLGVALGFVWCVIENELRRGDALNFGYGGEGFSTPWLHGLAGVLLAPARGVLLFVPASLLGIVLAVRPPREMPRTAVTITRVGAAFSALLVLAYAKWHAWHGAWYWGPRFMLPVSVLGVSWAILALRYSFRGAPVLARTGIVGVIVASVLVYESGAAVGANHLVWCLEAAVHGQGGTEEDCYWNAEFLPYRSFVRTDDLARMVKHRTTPVAIVGLLLLAAVAAGAPAAASGDRGGHRQAVSEFRDRVSPPPANHPFERREPS